MIQVTFTPETPEQAAVVAKAIAMYMGQVPVQETKPEPKAKAKAETKAETVSLETVRAKLTSISQAGKKTEVSALIAEFGASKLTEVKAEDYAALLAKAETL